MAVQIVEVQLACGIPSVDDLAALESDLRDPTPVLDVLI
jgi:hypothetical protein